MSNTCYRDQTLSMYCAEDHIGYQTEHLSHEDAQGFINFVVSSRWWRNRSIIREVQLRRHRGYKNLAVALYDNPRRGDVIIPIDLRYRMFILHELAHLIAPHRTWRHGAVFARYYHELIKKFLSPQLASDFRRECWRHNVVLASPNAVILLER